MTGNNEQRTHTVAEAAEVAADLVRKGIYSWSGPSYNPLPENRPELTALPLFVRVTDNKKVRAVFRLVPVYDEPGGVPSTVQKMTCNEVPAWMTRLRQVPFGVHVDPYRSVAKPVSLMFDDRCARNTLSADRRHLVDRKSDLKVRIDQIEPGIVPGAKDREARRERPTVVTYDAEERAKQRLPKLGVTYDEVRDIYRFDLPRSNKKGSRAHARHQFPVRADRLARVLWSFNEDTVTVECVRAELARLSD